MAVAFLVLRFIHVLCLIFLAGSLYDVLVRSHERRGTTPAFSFVADRLLESGADRALVRAVIFASTSIVTGAGMGAVAGGWRLLTSPTVLEKVFLWLVLMALLHYVLLGVERRILALIDEGREGDMVSDAFVTKLAALRQRRNAGTAACLFVALVTAILGMQVNAPYPIEANILMLVVVGWVSIRAYSSRAPFGWV